MKYNTRHFCTQYNSLYCSNLQIWNLPVLKIKLKFSATDSIRSIFTSANVKLINTNGVYSCAYTIQIAYFFGSVNVSSLQVNV